MLDLSEKLDTGPGLLANKKETRMMLGGKLMESLDLHSSAYITSGIEQHQSFTICG